MLSRFADLLVLATCLLWTVAVLFGLRRQQRFLISFLVTACLAGALTAAANEFRWQMVPAYVFLLLASLRAALDLGGADVLPVKTWRKVTARTLLVVATLVVIAHSHDCSSRASPTRSPPGRTPVGVRSEYWVDSSRAETFTADPDDYRRLLVEVWYPADPGQGREPGARAPRSRRPGRGPRGRDARRTAVVPLQVGGQRAHLGLGRPAGVGSRAGVSAARVLAWIRRQPDPERVRDGGARESRVRHRERGAQLEFGGHPVSRRDDREHRPQGRLSC